MVKADEAAVEEALGNLAESAQDFKARRKGSKAKDGDQVVMDFVGKGVRTSVALSREESERRNAAQQAEAA